VTATLYYLLEAFLKSLAVVGTQEQQANALPSVSKSLEIVLIGGYFYRLSKRRCRILQGIYSPRFQVLKFSMI